MLKFLGLNLVGDKVGGGVVLGKVRAFVCVYSMKFSWHAVLDFIKWLFDRGYMFCAKFCLHIVYYVL